MIFNPAPPIGPALGAAGLNIMGFCQQFNALTKDKMGDVLPVVITVFHDRTFTFITLQPPMAKMILKEVGIAKGSGVPNRDKVGKLTKEQVKNIANKKMPDLRAASIESAMKIVEGSARSMGIDIV